MKAFDVACVVFLSLFASLICLSVLGNLDFHKDLVYRQNEASLSSGLYKEDGTELIRLDEYYDNHKEVPLSKKNESLDEALTYFYCDFIDPELNGKGAERYLGYKIEAKYEAKHLFSEAGERLLSEEEYDGVYYAFYKGVYAGRAVPDLSLNKTYLSAKNSLIWSTAGAVFVGLTFSYLCICLLVPIVFKNTRQTFGMKLAGVVLIDDADKPCSLKKFFGYFFINFIVCYLGAFLTVLILPIVNLTISLVCQNRKGISERIFHTNFVNRI